MDKLILRSAILDRYASGYGNRIVELWKVGDKELINYVRDWFANATDAQKQALAGNNLRFPAVREFNAKIEKIITKQGKITNDFALTEMADLAKAETEVTNKALKSKVKTDISEILSMPILGQSVAALWAAATALWLMRAKAAVRNAITNDIPPDVALRGTRDQRYKDGSIFTRNNGFVRDAETQVTGVAGNTREKVYIGAKIKKEIWSATLDHRTCLVCGPLDGQVFEVGRGPKIPAHPRCRCTRLPDTGENEERPYVEDERSVKDIPKNERDGKIGRTKIKYKDFFERQTEKAKQHILGKARYDLYKSGELTIEEFTNDSTHKIYTLAELDRIYNLSQPQQK